MEVNFEQYLLHLQQRYKGKTENQRYHDENGEYHFPNGTIYRGGFHNGVFHGEGILYFPDPSDEKKQKGKYVATWKDGKAIKGKIIFQDGLEYSSDDWSYCTTQDRRFFSEKNNGFLPGDNIQLSNDLPIPNIPKHCYDTVDGFFDPLTNTIYSYSDKNPIRQPSSEEYEWIISHCRIGLN